ncbi:MAG TPA: hypothetical protein VHK91_11855, partial [Flavisolibacter sp.]|nr:hypothetical protein [Flavisolibacter sp.]
EQLFRDWVRKAEIERARPPARVITPQITWSYWIEKDPEIPNVPGRSAPVRKAVPSNPVSFDHDPRLIDIERHYGCRPGRW